MPVIVHNKPTDIVCIGEAVIARSVVATVYKVEPELEDSRQTS